jgi:hypothetical protein
MTSPIITSTNVIFSCTYYRDDDDWQYEMGKVYKYLRTYVPSTTKAFNKKPFAEFVELLKQAKASQW